MLEETGFDISKLIDANEFVEYKMNEQQSRLYVVRNVSMETKFVPRTRREIKVRFFLFYTILFLLDFYQLLLKMSCHGLIFISVHRMVSNRIFAKPQKRPDLQAALRSAAKCVFHGHSIC